MGKVLGERSDLRRRVSRMNDDAGTGNFRQN